MKKKLSINRVNNTGWWRSSARVITGAFRQKKNIKKTHANGHEYGTL